MTDQSRDRIDGLEPQKLMQAALQASQSAPNANERSAREELELRAEIEARLPDLELLELLGRGGMGSVFRARQRKLDREVALKVVYAQTENKQEFADRFEREARALARLNHPNLVAIFDYGQDGDFGWLLMEYVDGSNLRDLLQAGKLAPAEALSLVPKICDALQYAHDQGVVHRDVKPENILLDGHGGVKIADFGLAKLSESTVSMANLTGAQQVLGTFRYMAPEQLDRPLEVDHRADIYSLGVVLYEMLTGEIPMGRFDPPSAHSEATEAVDDVVLRALEKEPGRRYQHASDVKSDLETMGTPEPLDHTVQPGGMTVGGELSMQAIAAAGFMTIAYVIVAAFTLSLGFAERETHGWVTQTPAEVLIFGPTLLFVGSLIAGAVFGYRALRSMRTIGPHQVGVGGALFGLWGGCLLVINIISLVVTLVATRNDGEAVAAPLMLALFTLYAIDLGVILWLRGRFLQDRDVGSAHGHPKPERQAASTTEPGQPLSILGVVSAVLFGIGLAPILVLTAVLTTLPERNMAENDMEMVSGTPIAIIPTFVLGVPMMIVASVIGFIALDRIRRNWPKYRGLGAAVVGAWGGILFLMNLGVAIATAYVWRDALPSVEWIRMGLIALVLIDVAILVWIRESMLNRSERIEDAS